MLRGIFLELQKKLILYKTTSSRFKNLLLFFINFKKIIFYNLQYNQFIIYTKYKKIFYKNTIFRYKFFFVINFFLKQNYFLIQLIR